MTDARTGQDSPSGRRPALHRRHLRLLGTASWNVVDQALSALSNILLTVLVANEVGRAGFGAFSVAFVVFGICIGIERAMVGQPLSIRYSGADSERLADGRARAVGSALAIGLIGGAACVVAGLLLPGMLGGSLVAVGVVMPFLLVQDACRMVFFAASQARSAAGNDALWAVLQVGGILVLPLLTRPTPALLVLVWGGAAAVSAVVALVRLRLRPRPSGFGSWLREQRNLSGYLVAEYLLGTGAFQGGIIGVGALVGGDEGLAVVGAFRAAQTVLGPLNLLATAVQMFALPQLSRRRWMTPRQRTLAAGAVSGFLSVVAVGYSVVVLLMPDVVGQTLFSESWAGARQVLLPLAIGVIARAMSEGCAVMIYSLDQARRTFRIMTVEAPLVLTLMTVGALVGGAEGAAWGMCVDQVLLVPLWLYTLRSVVHSVPSEPLAGPCQPVAVPAADEVSSRADGPAAGAER